MTEAPYQPYFCEENIWRLCDEGRLDGESRHVVFISNEAGACALWNQRAAPTPDGPVIWDYHVIALAGDAGDYRVWDLDSRLETPVAFQSWWQGTFPWLQRLPAIYRPRFRVVEAATYLQAFSSDRSHMRDATGEWLEPPPDWSPIHDAELGMNLGRFVDMSDDWIGDVYEPQEFVEQFESDGTGVSV